MQRFRSDKSNYTNGSNYDGDDASSHFSGFSDEGTRETREIHAQRTLEEANATAVQDDPLETFAEEAADGEEFDLDSFTQVALSDKAEEETAAAAVANSGTRAVDEEEEPKKKNARPLGLKLFGMALVVVCVLIAIGLAVYFTTRDNNGRRAPGAEEKSAATGGEDVSPTATGGEDVSPTATGGEDVSPTASPSYSASAHILEILGEHTDASILTDDTTPQGQAFSQIVMEEEEASEKTSMFRVTQRYALMSLYFSTEPSSWASSFGWNDFRANECMWFGLGRCQEVDGQMTVTELYLSGNGLGGNIPEEVCLLEDLERLSLGENFIYGTLPQCIGGFTKLKSLKVQGNEITGDLPTGLLTISSLEEVEISDNRFDGTLDVLFEGSNKSPAGLTTFNANNNWLTGPIPVAFGFLPSLESLLLQDNQLKGPEAPESVCNLNSAFGTSGQFIVDCVIDCSCCTQVNC